MRTFILSLLTLTILTVSSSVEASPHGHRLHHHHHHPHFHKHWSPPVHHHWLLPAIIGGAVVYSVTRPDPMPVQSAQPIVVTPTLVTIDGVVYKREVIMVNGIAQEVLIRVQ